MSRSTLAEITIGALGLPPPNRLLRIVRDHDLSGRYALIEADPTELRKAIDNGKPYEWIVAKETEGLTPQQLGQALVDKIDEYRTSRRLGPER